MADNFVANAGVGGLTFASDEEAGAPAIHHPYSKLEWGADGTFTKVGDSDGTRLPIKPHMAGTATRTSVADSATAVSLLAANANRKGGSLVNTSSAVLYLGLGTVDPTTSDYTAKVEQDQVYTIPAVYTGQIKGIWASDPGNGASIATELT